MTDRESTTPSAGYELFMLALCTYALTVLVLQAAIPIDPSSRSILQYADYAACAAFFVDFCLSVYRSTNRARYLATWGWMDLLSSIPIFSVARWGRAARVLRVFRVIREIRAAKVLADFALHNRAQNTALAATLIAFLLITFSSIAVLRFEDVPGANIRSANDAVWWAFATITTVGYGDRYPTTAEGRVVAMVLMTAGVGLFGTFSAFLATWFIGEGKSTAGELAGLREEVAALRRAIEDRAI